MCELDYANAGSKMTPLSNERRELRADELNDVSGGMTTSMQFGSDTISIYAGESGYVVRHTSDSSGPVIVMQVTPPG